MTAAQHRACARWPAVIVLPPAAASAHREMGGRSARRVAVARGSSGSRLSKGQRGGERGASESRGGGGGGASPKGSQEGRDGGEGDDAAGSRARRAAAAAAAERAARENEYNDEEYATGEEVPNEDVLTVLAKGSSEVWSVRAACCNELSALMNFEPRRNEVAPVADKVSSLLLERLSDTHYKVIEAALACICSLAQTFPHAMEPHLERFLPQMLLRGSTGNKDSTRGLAHQAVQGVQSVFSPEASCPSC